MDQRKNKGNRIAAALSYNSQKGGAPEISGVGRRLMAKEIEAIARRYGIPIQRDSNLARKLATMEENSEIPPELYDEVARLFIDLGLEDY